MFTLLGQRSQDMILLQTYLPLWEELVQSLQKRPEHKNRRPIDLLYRQGTVAYSKQDFERAQTFFEPMLQLSRALNWDRSIATSLNYLSRLAIHRGDLLEARNYLEEGWKLIQRWQDKRHIANFLQASALLEQKDQNLERAIKQAYEANDIYHRLGMRQEKADTMDLIVNLEEELKKSWGGH